MSVRMRLGMALIAYDQKFIELQGGTALVLWGLWIVSPWWDSFGKTQYAILAKSAPPLFWGGVAIFIGLLMIAALMTRNSRARTVAAFHGFLFWMFVGILVSISDIRPAGIALYATMSLSAAWAYIRLGAIVGEERRNNVGNLP